MEPTGIQIAFFQQVKTMLSPNISLVDEVADLLNISNDSAYRRIRGEKPITLEEIQLLASHYKVSLDQFMNLKNDSFLFSGKLINSSTHNFGSWTQTVLQQLQHACTFSHRHIIYL